LVAVLNWRKDGVSKYILFEIGLCLRARKPLLVFVEDNLPDNIVPARILQRRFSRRSYLRQIKEHRHALQILKSYIGDQPPPQYQPSLTKRSCLLVGTTELPKEASALIPAWLETRGYNAIDFHRMFPFQFQDPAIFENLYTADLALCNVDSTTVQSQYLFGAIQTSVIPSINFTTNASYNFHPAIPVEFQPRIIHSRNYESFQQMLDAELELFEEDFIELDKQEEVETYASLLVDLAPLKGHYEISTRQVFSKEIIMGNKISIGNISGSIVNVDSMLEQVTQNINAANNVDEAIRKQLAELIEQLKIELQKIPPSNKEDVEALAESAKMLVEVSTKAQPNKTTVQINAEGLKRAAENIAAVMPTVVSIASGIIKTVFNLTGIPLP